MSTGIVNMWQRISIVCPNHEKPKKMDIVKNTEKFKTPFFACDTENCSCANRINIDDYEGIILKFNEIIATGADFTDYTNYFFSYKAARHKIKCKILKYSDDDIIMALHNETLLGKAGNI